MKCILLGATRGCGLSAALHLLSQGHTCYLLVRSPSSFTTFLSNEKIEIPESQKSNFHIIQGDALNPTDMRKLFTSASDGDPHSISFILFSLGGRVSWSPNPLRPRIIPEKVCSRGMEVLLPIYKELYPDINRQPRLVVVSSSGIGKMGHGDLPLALKPMYGLLLKEPHADKEIMEKLLCKEAGIISEDFNPQSSAASVEGKKTKGKQAKTESKSAESGEQDADRTEVENEDTQKQITLGNLIIVRPALLTDGPQTGKVRCDERLKNAYKISRKDVGWFIAEECFEDGSKWRGKGIVVAY